LFDHKDVNGVNVVLREILAVVGVDAAEAPTIAKAYKARNMMAVQRLEEALANDEMFYSWVEQSFPLMGVMNIITNQKEKAAEAIFKQYSFIRATREQQVVEGMQTSRSWAPAFYQELNGAAAKNYSVSELLLKYADPINQLSLEDQQRLGLIRKP
ncbi:MAG: hypothetical protein AABZ31_04660, partial [Bdellovibrionota bacterium]